MPAAGAPPVEDVFGVVAHPIRRRLLEELAAGDRRVSDLAAPLPVSRSAVSQHLRLMLGVGLISERRQGRERYYALRRNRLAELDRWPAPLDRVWAGPLHRRRAPAGAGLPWGG